MSPETLTHIVYVVLVTFFICVMAYMVLYNLQAKKREKALASRSKPFASHEAAIMAAQISAKQARRRKDIAG